MAADEYSRSKKLRTMQCNTSNYFDSCMEPGKNNGSMFYKTKLCTKFNTGNCPFDTKCNFAHGVEELRRPPDGWENLIAYQEYANQPIKFKTRPCKYFKDGSCPYADRCTFSHDIDCMINGSLATNDGFNRPPNWKTRMCNQWESTGKCSFADKCHFAHGTAELQKQITKFPQEAGFTSYNEFNYQSIPFFRPPVYGYGIYNPPVQNGLFRNHGNYDFN